MLKHRILSGCLIVAALLFGAYYTPPVGVWLILVAVSSLAQLEFYAMLNMGGIPAYRIVGVLCGAALISATFCSVGPTPQDQANAYKWENLVLVGSLLAIFIRQFPQKYNDKPLPTIGCTLLGIWYVPFMFNHFTRLAFAWDGAGTESRVSATGCLLILYLVTVVKATDSGAYFTGMLCGRHKLFPRISPGKTWEGFFGGIALGMAASLIFFHFSHGALGKVPFHLRDAVILGLVLSLAGTVGDLFESLLKRASGTKDSSAAIPGLGGLLDVLDSLLFGAPVMYYYSWFFLS